MPPPLTSLYRAARAFLTARRSLTIASYAGSGSGGGFTLSGGIVTPENALGVAAVYASVNRLATDLAALSYHLHRRRPDGGADRAEDDPRAELVALEPNDEQTAFIFRQTLYVHALLTGNGYARIERSSWDGSPQHLWLLDPRTTEPDRTRPNKVHPRGLLVYVEEGQPRAHLASDVLHIKALGFDGIKGKSPIALHREGIGLARAARDASAAFFGNGSKPGGVLEYPGKLTDEARARLRRSWRHIHEGPENAGAVAILEEGMKYSGITIPPSDAQYIETRKFEAAEVARIYNLPPHKIGLEALGDVEALNLEYLSAAILPWSEQTEQEWNRKLLFKSERRELYFEHALTSYLRGNSAARAQFYRELFNLGVMSPNQIARAENLEPIGPAGDRRYIQANNYQAIDQVAGTTPAAEDLDPPNTQRGEDPAATTAEPDDAALAAPGT